MSTYSPIPLVPKPDHVPAQLVYPIDFNAPPGGVQDLHLAWKRLQDATPDIVWTPHNGGHWILMRAEDIEYAQKNHDPFSMRSITLPRGSAPMRILPIEADPPEHGPYRALLTPLLSPKVVNSLQEQVRQLAISIIEELRPRGRCEFVQDFALQLPIAIFMYLAALPMSDRDVLLEHAEKGVRPLNENDRRVAFGFMNDYIDKLVVERRRNPGTDIVSSIVHGKVFDRPLREDEIHSMLLTVLFGGLDTVAASMGFAAHFLARSPSHRRQLIERPELIPNAIEELMRRHGVSSTARVMTRDFEYKDVKFLKDDCVLVEPLLFGLDERRFKDPLTVDFERTQVIHAAFGNGPHRCPGSMLARSETRVFLEEWLKRIPDFAVPADDPAIYAPGTVNALKRLPLVWSA